MNEKTSLDRLELIDFPFDQYQRYRITQEIAGLIRERLGQARLNLLDVGGFFQAITGQEVLPIFQFLPQDHTLVADVVPCSLPGYVQASGASLPFADGAFDVVSTCDTLEHVPPAERPAFVDELLRVSGRYVILSAPFDDPRTRLGEQIIFDYVKAFYQLEQPQLKEHLENGLPERERVRAWLERRGYPYADFASGYLHHWLPMMLLKQYLFGHPETERLHLKLDRYYNQTLHHLDQRSPGYRHVFVISKVSEDEAWMAQVHRRFQAPPGPPDDDGVALTRSLLSLIEWEREWQREAQRRDREQAQQKLHQAIQALNANAQIQELVWRTQLADEMRALLEQSIHPGLEPSPVQAEPDPEPAGRGVLMIPPHPLGPTMPTSAARFWELARVLSQGQPVTLLVADPEIPPHPGLSLLPHPPEPDWELLVAAHRTVVAAGESLLRRPDLSRAIVAQGKYLVVDLTFPRAATNDAGRRDRKGPAPTDGFISEGEMQAGLIAWSSLNQQLKLADFALCASELERDFWLGLLAAAHRLNPATYQDDPSLRRLLAPLPFGLPAERPTHQNQVLKGAHSQIASSDRLALWLGELDQGSDPLTLLRAWAGVVAERPQAKLVFIAPQIHYTRQPASRVARRAVSLSQELGLYQRSVIFVPAVPYPARQDYLLEADVGVYVYADDLAGRYASAAPLSDYMWAGLPTISTGKNNLAQRLDAPGLIHRVEPGDVAGIKATLLALLAQPAEKQEGDLAHLTWEWVAEPLKRYCQAPWRAADKQLPEYARWTSTAWEQLLLNQANLREQNQRLTQDKRHLTEHIQAIRRGRVMRWTTALQGWWRRITGQG